MVQATTPTFILTLPDSVDLSFIEHMYFTLVQGSLKINKTDADESLVIAGNSISVFLNQSETLRFEKGIAKVQLNWTYADGSRACSNIADVSVSPNLLPEVLE